jgi:hypothetical protein
VRSFSVCRARKAPGKNDSPHWPIQILSTISSTSDTLPGMPGTVFLSCGQQPSELKVAVKIKSLLEAPPFRLNVFIAASTNNMHSLNHDVLKNLSYADYVLFVNFHRPKSPSQGSIYSHQELAMAHALGHEDILLFSEEGAPDECVMHYMVFNGRPFTTTNQLLSRVRAEVTRAGWNRTHSRFLRVTDLYERDPVDFNDGVGNLLRGKPIDVVLKNQSKDFQEGIIVTLETFDGETPDYLHRSPLKVAGQRGYEAAVPPGSSVIFDILMEGSCISAGRQVPGAFLVSALDLVPLPPLFDDDDDHEMTFRVDAREKKTHSFHAGAKKGRLRAQERTVPSKEARSLTRQGRAVLLICQFCEYVAVACLGGAPAPQDFAFERR